MNRGKEGKPHGTKHSLKNGNGAGPAINNKKLPSLTHPKQRSQVGEGLLIEILGKISTVCSMDGKYCSEITLSCTKPRM